MTSCIHQREHSFVHSKPLEIQKLSECTYIYIRNYASSMVFMRNICENIDTQWIISRKVSTYRIPSFVLVIVVYPFVVSCDSFTCIILGYLFHWHLGDLKQWRHMGSWRIKSAAKRLFIRQFVRGRKTLKTRSLVPCEGHTPDEWWIPWQRASNAEILSFPRRRQACDFPRATTVTSYKNARG